MAVIPRGDMVLIELLRDDDKVSAGGLVIPASIKRDFVRARVLDIGPGHYLENGSRARISDLSVGNIVLVRGDQRHPQTGQVMMKNLLPVSPDENIVLVPESLIYAII